MRNGEWRLRDGFKFLEISSDSWYNLSEKQRKAHMQHEKAGELFIQLGLVVPVPGADASLNLMVASKSGDPPHFVKPHPL